MKGKETKSGATQEPIGIVIAGTFTPPRGTVFSAYVWGPAPATQDEDPKAA
jgi:hypothetical protein